MDRVASPGKMYRVNKVNSLIHMAPDLSACVRELVPFSWSESKQLDVATDVPFPIAVEGDGCSIQVATSDTQRRSTKK